MTGEKESRPADGDGVKAGGGDGGGGQMEGFSKNEMYCPAGT